MNMRLFAIAFVVPACTIRNLENCSSLICQLQKRVLRFGRPYLYMAKENRLSLSVDAIIVSASPKKLHP